MEEVFIIVPRSVTLDDIADVLRRTWTLDEDVGVPYVQTGPTRAPTSPSPRSPERSRRSWRWIIRTSGTVFAGPLGTTGSSPSGTGTRD